MNSGVNRGQGIWSCKTRGQGGDLHRSKWSDSKVQLLRGHNQWCMGCNFSTGRETGDIDLVVDLEMNI
jgi:hypothetical protein